MRCDVLQEVSAGTFVELAVAQLVVGCLAIGEQDESAPRRRQVGPGAAKHGDGNIELPFTVKNILHYFRGPHPCGQQSQHIHTRAPASCCMHLGVLLTSPFLLLVYTYIHLLLTGVFFDRPSWAWHARIPSVAVHRWCGCTLRCEGGGLQ